MSDKPEKPEFLFSHADKPELILIQILFHFSILMEYQLLDLQASVREFVDIISNSIQKTHEMIKDERDKSEEIYYKLFPEKKDEESYELSKRANDRADVIFSQAKSEIGQGEFNITEKPLETETIKQIEAHDQVLSQVAKELENMCRLEERLRPQIYNMVSALNFEDIQSQRLEHSLTAQKRLNEGLIKFLKAGINNNSVEEIQTFILDLLIETRKNYTMKEERSIFDQVFLELIPLIKRKKT